MKPTNGKQWAASKPTLSKQNALQKTGHALGQG